MQGFSVSSEPPKSLEKKGKNTQKSKEFLEKQKSKEIQKSKEKKIRAIPVSNFSFHPKSNVGSFVDPLLVPLSVVSSFGSGLLSDPLSDICRIDVGCSSLFHS